MKVRLGLKELDLAWDKRRSSPYAQILRWTEALEQDSLHCVVSPIKHRFDTPSWRDSDLLTSHWPKLRKEQPLQLPAQSLKRLCLSLPLGQLLNVWKRKASHLSVLRSYVAHSRRSLYQIAKRVPFSLCRVPLVRVCFCNDRFIRSELNLMRHWPAKSASTYTTSLRPKVYPPLNSNAHFCLPL